MDEQEKLSRRSFLAMATGAMGAIIGTALIVPAIAFIVGPALQRNKEKNWIRLGPTSKVELGTPTLFRTEIESQSGWIVNQQEISVYVLTENGRDYISMSNICTHLGCRVRWIDEQDQFFCPCHNAIFNKEGLVVSGPPPRPLDRYETKVENGQIFILGG